MSREVDESYLQVVQELLHSAREKRGGCRILYAPLRGTGNLPLRLVLEWAGFKVSMVPEQVEPDSEFSTVKDPNPEEPEVFLWP